MNINLSKHYPFEKFASYTRYTSFDILPYNQSLTTLYIADTNGQFNLMKSTLNLNKDLDLKDRQHYTIPLTHFIDESVREFFLSPKDNRNIIFFADYQGTENYQIYSIDLFDTNLQLISKNPNVKYEWGYECFSHDGKYIVYSSNEKNPSNLLIYIRDTELNNEAFCLTKSTGWFEPGYWSPDNQFLTCRQILTDTDSLVYLIDVKKAEMISLDIINGRSKYELGPWLQQKHGFFILSDIDRKYLNLAFYNLKESNLEWIVTPDFDVELIEISKDNSRLLWTINEQGFSKLFTKNLITNEIQEIKLNEKGVIEQLKISSDGNILGFLMTTSKTPFNIYILNIESQEILRTTNAFPKEIPENKLIDPQLSSYKSFDNLKIPFFLYRPQNQNSKYGIVISIHGGPNEQERPEYAYSGLYQYILNHGLAIMAPNYRGSSGYGKDFEKLIYHDWGGNELKDLEYAVKWLLSQDWVDTSKIGIFGRSFGGFEVLSCISRLPQYWKAAVDIFGPSNLITTTTTNPPHWKDADRELIGDPHLEKDFLNERSPVTYVDNIKAYLLVIQGAHDPRVVKYESDQIVEKLRNHGKQVEYLVFEDEGHGFTKYSNMVKAYKAAGEFLVKNLT